MPPLVSVIIPTRDALQYLPAAIASVGTDLRVEILVVDDGSTDGSLDYLAGLAKADPRVRILHGGGRGPAPARNRAIATARGRYCAFLDADDVWMPGKLDVQLAFHEANPDIGFSFTDYRHVTMEGEDRGGCFAFWPQFQTRHGDKTEPFRLDRPLSTLYGENVVGTSTVMARTDVLLHAGGYSTSMVSAEDWELWLALAARAPVGAIPGHWADYLMHRPGNMTGKMALRILAMQAIGARYRKAALAEDPGALKLLDARLAAARAEIAEQSGAMLRAAWLRLKALLAAPSRRTALDLAGALRRAG